MCAQDVPMDGRAAKPQNQTILVTNLPTLKRATHMNIAILCGALHVPKSMRPLDVFVKRCLV